MSHPTPPGFTAHDSAMISASHYDRATRTLSVQFRGGPKVYRYANVPVYHGKGLASAEKKGAYFARFIKGKYPVGRE